ncbi:MAG TPA: Rne/Rng family ribonuclease [candidate division Zixibacteria bacterium]|nr:Rne/Rng family ribonuclease [candidate division Zixibacteria bacterium]HBZ00240.1 Rne/Rng family ribonuclease [candidate division Zixibacteria bacterium]
MNKELETKKNSEIFVNVTDYETRIGVVEQGKLVELLVERPEKERIVGNIYKGKVTAVLPGIQAAFVDIGMEKAGFLHFSDTSDYQGEKNLLFDMDYVDEETLDTPRVTTRRRSSIITDFIKKGQELLVQVIKEPINNKGPRLTTQISLPGRYVVMVPGGKHVGISKKISNGSEKKRLRKIVGELKPPHFGIIVRTVAEGKDQKDFKADMSLLTKLWGKMKKKVEESKAPDLVHKEMEITGGIIRDLLTPDVTRLVVDNKKEYLQIIKYLKALDPRLCSSVELYSDPEPLFDKYAIEPEIDKMLDRKVWLRGGANIVIDQTEALVAVDVNTGRLSAKGKGEDAIYRANIEAAREIARQIRLRDIGGILIIDFIDMQDRENRRRVYDEFKNALSHDRSENYISSISDLGMVEMTRERIRPSFMHTFSDSCPVCGGVGRVLSRESMAVKIERWFKRAAPSSQSRHYQLVANPQVGEILLAGNPTRMKNMEKTSKLRIDLIVDTSLHPEHFKVIDLGTEVDVTEKFKAPA